MKAAFIAVALAALVQAQSRDDIPSCALPCLDASVTANTKCSTTDFACICQNFNVIQTQATSCVLEKCGADVALNKVLPATQALCSAQGSGSAGSSAAGTTSAAAATTSAAAATTAVSSAPASSAPVSSAPVSSAPASSAPATTVVQTSAAPVTSIVTSTVPVGTGAPSGNSTSPGAGPAPNGAAGLVPGLALLALGVLAL